MKREIMLMDGKGQYCEDVILPKLIYRYNTILSKTSTAFLLCCRNQQTDSIMYLEMQRT